MLSRPDFNLNKLAKFSKYMMASVQGIYLSSQMCSLVSRGGFVAFSLILYQFTEDYSCFQLYMGVFQGTKLATNYLSSILTPWVCRNQSVTCSTCSKFLTVDYNGCVSILAVL